MSSKALRERIAGILASNITSEDNQLPLALAQLVNALADAVEEERPTAGPHFHEGPEFDEIAGAINSYIPKGEAYADERFQLHRWLSAASEALHERIQLENMRDALDNLAECGNASTIGEVSNAASPVIATWRNLKAAPAYRKLASADEAAINKISHDMRLQIAHAFGWRTDFSGCEQAPPLSNILAEIGKMRTAVRVADAEVVNRNTAANHIIERAKQSARDWYESGVMLAESGDIAGHGDLAEPGGYARAIDAAFGPQWERHLMQVGTDSYVYPERAFYKQESERAAAAVAR